ncbi:MAG: PLP-dependent aminotransferase family protein [SAR202 cluster bacterium]|nr:PLP-dependent aminotransferase family protein [SAR202 cluster bacterium]
MPGPQPFNYDKLFAKNAQVNTRAPSRHAKYDFAVAYPDPDNLPLEGLADSLRTALEREGRDLAYYPEVTGLPSLRQWVADKLARDRNMKLTADDVILTAGSGEAIAMVIQALTDPGDVCLTEEYVYLGTMRQMKRFGSEVVGVKCDGEGFVGSELRAALKRLTNQGKKIKYVYTIPSFQNPLGWSMSLARRKELLSITREYSVPVFEDDCYWDLRFEGEDITSIHSLDTTGQVIYCGSFSKILAPGMRLGYLVAPKPVLERALSFKAGGGVNQFAALAIDEYVRHHLKEHVDDQNQALRAKRDAMLAALGENFGGIATWSVPKGGLYIWVTFPEGTDMAALQETAFNEGVGYYHGAQFSPEGKGKNCVRLCFGHPDAKTNYDGVTELARIMERHGVLPA